MKKITVIIPCYNGFRYISNCLKSLEAQTFKDFSVLVVDDCSTDDSLLRLEEYSKNTTLDFRIVHNETNQRLAYTRQIGIKHSTTEWICFCDCDDWYDSLFLERMLTASETQKADVVLCQCTYAFSNGKTKLLNEMRFLSEKSTKREFLAYAFMSMCTCIFKKSLFEGIYVPQINTAEDGAVTPQVFAKANKITIIHDGLYYYFMRNDSMSSKPSKQAYKDLLEAQRVLNLYIDRSYIDELEFIGIKNICYSAVLISVKAGVNKKSIIDFCDSFDEKYPNWYKNKYKNSMPLRKKVFLFFVKNRWFAFIKAFVFLHGLLSHN